jgi:Ser/Thr protein kinase RdoA (MazF antagonist)
LAEPSVILPLFGLSGGDFTITRAGSGHIHQTYLVSGKRSFVLQRVNINVFTQPEIIARNLRTASTYLKAQNPEYPFLTCIASTAGRDMEYDSEGYPWRLFPYVENTVTYDQVGSPAQAYEAASQFARLTRHLDGVDPAMFEPTIPRFHDLSLRWNQFETALSTSNDTRRKASEDSIMRCYKAESLVAQYEKLIAGGSLRLRVVHNDTKINNVLFDRVSGKTVAVIDLDTLMPGYFIYDLGDMVRTFVCPVSEEEKDLSKVVFRRDVYDALLEGYRSEMDPVLTPAERTAIPFAGKMMTYIMALRFLADYLRGNTYYHITYPEQNLVRAANQLKLLEVLEENIPEAS